ncbi:MAG: hypothetical protein V3T72_18390, partial [Thermoanaerobaculia bacterium]
MKLTTRALKQEVCHVPAPKDIDYDHLGTIISDGDIGCYSRPDAGNNVLIGSEDPECDELEWVDDPDDYNPNFTDQWQTQVVREAQRVEDLLIPNRPKGLVGLYDCTPDWIPIYDKSGTPDGGAHRGGRGRPRPRPRSGVGHHALHREVVRRRLLQPAARDQSRVLLLRHRLRPDERSIRT